MSEELSAAAHRRCPTCSWPSRETVGMVCQTCGADYRPADVIAYESGYNDGVEQGRAEVRAAVEAVLTPSESHFIDRIFAGGCVSVDRVRTAVAATLLARMGEQP